MNAVWYRQRKGRIRRKDTVTAIPCRIIVTTPAGYVVIEYERYFGPVHRAVKASSVVAT